MVRADYASLSKTLAALTDGENDEIALMATVVCELHHADDRFDWTGFYRVVGERQLMVGPYQGLPWMLGTRGSKREN